MGRLFNAKVLRNTHLSNSHTLIEFKPLTPIQSSSPGQFYMIQSYPSLDPLLKRPFSLLDYRDGNLLFLIQIKGKGTESLFNLTEGHILKIIGPLGNGFPLKEDNEKLLILAGGIGLASVFSLMKKYNDTVLFYGSRDKEGLVLENRIKDISSELYISTEDGSIGKKGDVLSILKSYLDSNKDKKYKFKIYACGPDTMYKKMSKMFLDRFIKVFVSLEERMACGIGACLGCAVKSNNGYKMVCKEGPVFDLKDIVW